MDIFANCDLSYNITVNLTPFLQIITYALQISNVCLKNLDKQAITAQSLN